MLTVLAIVTFIVGVVLNLGGVYALARWQAGVNAARVAHQAWEANGANPDNEPAPAPGLASAPSMLGISLVILACAMLFLFAYHLGQA